MKRGILIGAVALCALGGIAEAAENTQTVRLIQDDAQDYMVSKTYILEHVQSNDVLPFVAAIIKRYNINSSVGSINDSTRSRQILIVTCPEPMIPYVDDFIAKVDRAIEIDGKAPGEIIKGTGITNEVYRPKYRSGQVLVDIIVNAAINEGPYGSVYGYDRNSNQIYWKDNLSNSQFALEFLEWLDRPPPQISFHFNLYEVRESIMRDVGVDYLAWKNGPGLNIFQAGFQSFGLSSAGSAALQAMSGPFGGFFFAPQFDASFIRLLQQNGKADIRNSADLTVSNSDSKSYELLFNPQFQNIAKSDNDKSSVGVSGIPADTNQVYLKIIAPIVNLHTGEPEEGYPEDEAFSVAAYVPGAYTRIPGTLCFGYDVQSAYVVERNNLGAELVETSQLQGNAEIVLGHEVILAQWDQAQEVEQTIGMPILSDIPFLKYFFGTTTVSRETTRLYLTVTAEMLDTGKSSDIASGALLQMRQVAR